MAWWRKQKSNRRKNGNGVKDSWKDAKNGNGANAVTSASFEDEEEPIVEDVTTPSQPTYPGYVPPVSTSTPAPAQEAYGDRFKDDPPAISTHVETTKDQQISNWRKANPQQYGEPEHEYHNRMAWDLKGDIGLMPAPGMVMGQEMSITHPWTSENRQPFELIPQEIDPETGLPIPGTGTRGLPFGPDPGATELTVLPLPGEEDVQTVNTFFGRMAESNPEEAYEMYRKILSGDASEEVKDAYRNQAPADFADRLATDQANEQALSEAEYTGHDDFYKTADAIVEGSEVVDEDPHLYQNVLGGINQGDLSKYNRQFIERNVNFSADEKARLLEAWDNKDAEKQAEVDAAKGATPQDTYNNLLQQVRSGYLTDRTAIQRAGLPPYLEQDLLGKLTQKETKGADFEAETFDEFFEEADAINQGSDVIDTDPHHYQDLYGTIDGGNLERYNRQFIERDVNLTEPQREALLAHYDLKVAERDGWQAELTPMQIYSDFESRIANGEEIDRTALMESNLSDDQKAELGASITRRDTEIRSNKAYSMFEGRFLNDPNKPSEHDIITNRDLTQDQKNNLIARYFPEDDVPDEVAEVEGEEELSDRDRYGRKLNATRDFLNSGGDPAMVNWNELESLAGLAGVSDLFNKQRIIESGAAEYDKQNRPKRQEKNYNDLIGKFMSGGVVSPHELATSDLNEQQRKDLQGRLDEQTRRQNAEIERKKNEELNKQRIEDQKTAHLADIEAKREEAEQLRIEEQQSEMQNPTINTSDKAERSVAYNTLYDKIVVGRNDPSQLPSLYEIETSQLSADEKARLKGMLPKDPPTLDEQAAQQEADEAESKSAEEYAAATAGKEIIGEDSLRDIIADVMSNLAQIGSEEDIIALVNARLQGQNLFADSATVLNTVADVNKFYYKQFQGTRSRPLTFVERKELEAKERSDSVVTADEMDTKSSNDALFEKHGIGYDMRDKPEEAYAKAIENGASASEAYKLFKLAGGWGAPPQGRGGTLPDEPIGDDDSISVFTISEEHGGYGHPFYADDVYNLKSRPGESEEAFWDRVEDAEWLTELKDPDTAASYSQISLSESDAIVDKMISTLGKNAEDSVTLTNALNSLQRFQNSDDFTKSDLRGLFETALTDALASMGGEDLDDQKRMLRESARSDYDDALEEANRYFLVNGLSGSGQEQRRFEELSSEHLKGLREIDMAINEKRNEYAAKQVTLLTDSLAQLANIDVTENKLDLDAEDLEERGRQFDASLKQSRY